MTLPGKVIGALAALLGAVALGSWITLVTAHLRPLPNFVAMTPSSSVAVILGGMTLVIAGWRSRLLWWCGIVCATLMIVLSGHAVDGDWWPFSFLPLSDSEWNAAWGLGAPGQLSAWTSLSLLIEGVGLWLALFTRRSWLKVIAQVIGMTGFAVGLFVSMAYAYGALDLTTPIPSYAPMSLTGAMAVAMLGLGPLLAGEPTGLAAILRQPWTAGRMVRRMLPMVIATLLFTGWLWIWGVRSGLFGKAVGTGAFVTINILLFLLLFGVYGGVVGRAEAQRESAISERLAERERFETTLRSIGDGVITTDPQGLVMFMNPMAEKLTGWTSQEAKGKDITDIFRLGAGDARERVGSISEVLQTNRNHIWPDADRLVSVDGRERRISSRAATLHNREGRMTGMVLAFTDVTEQLALEASRRFLSSIVTSSYAAIVGTNGEGTIISWNEAAKELYGYSEEEIIGRPKRVLVPEDQLEEFDREMTWLRGGNKIEHQDTVRQRKDGTRVDVALVGSPICGENGEIEGMSFIARDISEQKTVEEALKQSELFHDLTRSIHEVFWMKDWQSGKLLYVSPVYEYIWQRPRAKLYEDPCAWLEAVHPEDRERIGRQCASQEATSKQMEFRLLRDNGEVRWVFLRSFPVYDHNGKVYRIAGVAEDITDYKVATNLAKRRETELARIARLGTMGELASGVSHELNQPLSAVNSYATGCIARVKEGRLDPEALLFGLERITQQITRAGRIIHRLREFARHGETERQWQSMNELVRDVAELLHSDLLEHETDLELSLADDVPEVLLNTVEMQQVLINLVRNAMQAMQEAGSLTRRIDVSTERVGDCHAMVLVSDTGPGLKDQELARLFEPFYTTKEEGLGIGLNICETIVERHGGRLTADRNEVGGLRFRMLLPVTDGAGMVTPAFPK